MNENFELMVKRLSPTLKRITYKLNGHFTFFDDDDLFQEALEHLWGVFEDGKVSDKTDSYILQGCYFYLKNYIRKTMDKAKLISLNAIMDEDDRKLEEYLSAGESSAEKALEQSFIEDLPAIKALHPREKQIMKLSLTGMTVREIGQRMGMSHVMVIKIKKSIKNKCAGLKNTGISGYQN